MPPLQHDTDDAPNAYGLDPTFGEDGVVGNISPGDATLQIVSLGPDGKLILVGSVLWEDRLAFQLVQLLENGAMDPSFANDGILKGGFKDGAEAFPYGAKRYPDGKILLVGTHYGDIEYLAFARFLENGKPDRTFGNDGLVLQPRTNQPESRQSLGMDEPPHSDDSPSSKLAIGPNGEIIMASQTSISRYDQHGKPDQSFNGTGHLIVDFLIYAVAVSSNGSITVIGSSEGGGIIARFIASGAPDRNFGVGGRTERQIEGARTLFHGLSLREDGSAFVAGFLDRDPNDVWGRKRRGIIMAFNSNGQPNLVFNGGQPVVTELPSTDANIWWGIGEDPTLGVVVTGSKGQTSYEVGLIARYDYTGKADPTFGDGGFQSTEVGFGDLEWWESVTVQPDHKIVVAGIRHHFPSTGCAARLLATNQS
jgi:uncharacterized delta-60 repeat protein